MFIICLTVCSTDKIVCEHQKISKKERQTSSRYNLNHSISLWTLLHTTEPWLRAIFTASEYTAVPRYSWTLRSRFRPHGCRACIPPFSCSCINLSSRSLFHSVRLSVFVIFLKWLSFNHLMHFIIQPFHWYVQNVAFPCLSQELLPFLSVMYFFVPAFSTNYSSILSHLIFLSISWFTSQSCSQIHI